MARTRVFLALLFVFSFIVLSSLSITGWFSNPVVVGLMLAGVLIVSTVFVRYRERSNGDDEGIWNITPDWQYEGRFAEAGGLTRSEQSNAIEDVDERAKEIENVQGRDQRR